MIWNRNINTRHCTLQNTAEIFVMDIIDEVSSDILTSVLKNTSPEDKVNNVVTMSLDVFYLFIQYSIVRIIVHVF